MPTKQRRLTGTNRRKKKTQEHPLQMIYLRALYEKNTEKSDTDIQTIADHTFGKVYSDQIVSQSQITKEISSSNTISITGKSRKKKRNYRK
ncbi:unnamed protein product [Adineta steineri]|uniref:Uncharacterized protein n=1 Tax=Adineta steineri TaxID=433720 RepID=A0A814WZY3_9BILA|nr:unnamed protein product [Adineta steineri]CAF1207678.1 unnamed protein product [Adineta steineri]CAF1218858.1 unnamed protein product [Adineta steineri]